MLFAGRDAFLQGLHEILLYAGVVAFLGAALCALLIRPRDFVRPPRGA